MTTMLVFGDDVVVVVLCTCCTCYTVNVVWYISVVIILY